MWGERVHAFPIEIERLAYFFVGGCLVDDDVSNAAEQCEVDDACRVFLVVAHQFE